MTSGERIKQLRLERNWSQARLAKEVGLHTSSIQDWEAGISLPSAKVLDRLCDLFNTSSDYILCRTDEESISLHGFSPYEQILIKTIIQAIKICILHFNPRPSRRGLFVDKHIRDC